MNAEWIEAHVKLLSVPPVFDEATATNLVSALADELAEGASSAPHFLPVLRLAGLLTGEPGCWQISDSTRAEFRDLLVKENPVLFRRALDICVDHMRNGLASTMRHVFGAANANLLVSTLALGRETGDHAAFDGVIRQLNEGHRLGRASGETIASVALSQLPPDPERLRQTEFLLGMQAWRLNQRPRAENHFDRVLDAGFSDLADAISAHLTGVALSVRGEYTNAVTRLQRSVRTLRELGDTRGLCQALISLGIAEREISVKRLSEADDNESSGDVSDSLITQADNSFQAAQKAFDDAAGLAKELEDEHLEAQAHMELAASFARWNDIDAAIQESETARAIISPNDRNYVRLMTQLGSLYRQDGDYETAGKVLDEAAQISLRLGRESSQLARLLNVQAANERRRGKFDTARSYALNSIEMGRRLKDKRHLGHALHTLATITLEVAKNGADLDLADKLLSESREALGSCNDTAGLRMIGQTRASLDKRRAEFR